MSDYDPHKRYPPRRARRQPEEWEDTPAGHAQGTGESNYYDAGIDMTAARYDNEAAHAPESRYADDYGPAADYAQTGSYQEAAYTQADYAAPDQPYYGQPQVDEGQQAGYGYEPAAQSADQGYAQPYAQPCAYEASAASAAPTPASPQPAASSHAPSPRPRAARAKRASKGKRALVLTAIVVAVIAVAALALYSLGGLDTLLHGGKDYEGKGKGEVTVVIPKGATGRDIAQILQKQDVVASAGAFEKAFKANSLSQGVQPGTYKLHKKMASAEALALLLDPAAKSDLRITVPEGFTVEQIKRRLVSVGGFAPERVAAALKDTAALGLPQQAKGNLEGWLAPDSYAISQDEDPAGVLKKMVALQIKRLDEVGVAQDARQAVLLKASILEREVNQKRYYPMVARVIENRLQDNPETHGLLQMDSTVLFGLGKVGGIPTKEQLKQDTPYNTYLHKGLPPGPIGTPGLDAIKGVVNPQPGTWLYYVTVDLKSGETKFATTHEEHKANIALLRQYCKANPGVC